jgi:GH15 family glucan-1,4-alpha-glucosidase
VKRSLIVLKGLTYAPTGGMVAAPTTSIPEQAGGVRNWDYRYCWLRDATFTLLAFGTAGYVEEAQEWRNWLLRAVAGSPDQLQIMYGLGGERRAFPNGRRRGFQGSKAHGRFESETRRLVSSNLISTARSRTPCSRRAATGWLRWRDGRQSGAHFLIILKPSGPDEGIWEVRGPRQHFTHSKVMAWVAFDRAARSVEEFGVDGPIERWRS